MWCSVCIRGEMGDATFLSGNRTKAGLPENGGLERHRIDEIIRETSAGSKYYQFQERHEKKIEERVSKLVEKREHLEKSFQRDPQTRLKHEKELEAWIDAQEKSRDLSKTFVHIDMDAFFAAVETLEHPEWASIPMAVGGDSMLSTSNYEARKFGVVAAMPGYIARKLCPQLLIVPPNFEKYQQAAAKFHPVFAKYDPNFTHYSLDEANLDLTDWIHRNPEISVEELVQRIRDEVFDASGLTCSAGIASNKLLAKVCSNMKKPNGQFYLSPEKDAIQSFIDQTPLRKLSGIGKVMAKTLKILFNAETCKDLVRTLMISL